MSSMLAKYRQIQAQIKSIESEMRKIESDPEFQKEKEFFDKLKALLGDYEKTPEQVVRILNPDAVAAQKKGARGPRPGTPRKRNRYVNPHTGEEVVSASGNHNVLRRWREENPGVDIKDWIVESVK